MLLTSLLRAHQGGNCKSPAAIYRGRFPLQNPESRRAGLGPWLRGHALPRSSSAGNAEIMISFAVGFGSAGEGAAGSALCRGHRAGGTGLRMDGHQLHAKVHLSPKPLHHATPRPQPCLCPPAPPQGPPYVFPAGDSSPAMIPSLASDACAEPRHVAQRWCCRVPVAMVCLLSPSSLQALRSIRWSHGWSPPSCRNRDMMGPIQPLWGQAATRCRVSALWALSPVSRFNLQRPCDGHRALNPVSSLLVSLRAHTMVICN